MPITIDGTTGLTGDVKFNNAIVETVYALSGTTPAIDPSNGTIQTWTLSGTSGPTDSLSAGESVVLMITNTGAHSLVWPTITWLTSPNTAPSLSTTQITVVVIWKVGSTLYGKY